MTDTILDRIVADVRTRIEPTDARVANGAPAVRSLVASITRSVDAGRVAIVAEHKRRSPSAGVIAPGVVLEAQVRAYARGGAAGISVLTERDHFGGCLDDLRAARATGVDVPLLCKDFILEESQLVAARAAGADAALLIAVLHDAPRLRELVDAAHDLGLEVLAEVRDEVELERVLVSGADLVGINARDLRTFEVDLAVVDRLAGLVGGLRPVVAESGIRTVDDVTRVRQGGASAVLVGELLMRSDDPAGLVTRLGAGG